VPAFFFCLRNYCPRILQDLNIRLPMQRPDFARYGACRMDGPIGECVLFRSKGVFLRDVFANAR
jgi:hypothetical protein